MKDLKLYTLLVAGVVAFATACSPAAPAAPSGNSAAPSGSNSSAAVVQSTIPDIQVTAQDFSFTAPDQIQSGIVAMTLTNTGKEPHQAQLAKLNDGVTMDQLQAALKSGDDSAALKLVSLAGGPNAVAPGAKQTVTMNLAPGNYLMLCFVSGADNVPHLAKGMIKPFQVASAPAGAAGAPNQVAAPTSDGKVALQDFSIAMPDNLTAGTHTWEVTNAGPQPHELTIMKLQAGKTMADLQTAMQGQVQGPPPVDPVGGLGAISPNSSAWVTADLTPGDYIALCFVPDPSSGKAHAELGMIKPFTVK